MNKRNLRIVLVILVTFIGGFFAGIFYINSTSKTENISLKQAPKVKRNPVPREVPKEMPKPAAKQSKVIIGYVQDFRDPGAIAYSNLTHVIFSFAHPTKDGHLLFNGDMAKDNLRAIVAKAHAEDTKAILAVGGWYHIKGGESYPYFKAAISNSTARKSLETELVDLVSSEDLDGIDIDFEHPRTNEDAANLAIFMKDLGERLHGMDKELSIAVNAKVHSVAGTEIHNVVYDPTMFQYVDHVNIMAYDGQWDGNYNAANLSPYPYNVNIVNYWSNLFDKNKLSKEKLVLGIPLYAQPENPNAKQLSYGAIIQNNPGNAAKDNVSMNGITYYYNGEATVQKKVKLALDHGFGGMMLWEEGLDAKGARSLTGVIYGVISASKMYTLK